MVKGKFKLVCWLWGHKMIVVTVAGNWYDVLCVRCGECHTYIAGEQH